MWFRPWWDSGPVSDNPLDFCPACDQGPLVLMEARPMHGQEYQDWRKGRSCFSVVPTARGTTSAKGTPSTAGAFRGRESHQGGSRRVRLTSFWPQPLTSSTAAGRAAGLPLTRLPGRGPAMT